MSVDVSASPQVVEPVDRLNRLLQWGLKPGSVRAYWFALCCVGAALGIRLIFWLFKPDLVIFATYYPAVLLATLIGGWQAGIVAQVAGGLVAWLYFDPSFAMPPRSLDAQIADFGLYGLSSGLIIWAAEQYRHLVQRLEEEEHYRRLVVEELKHRLRNKLAVVQAVLGHELRGHEDMRGKIVARLKALARADELLARPDGEMVDLQEILQVELSLFSEARFTVKGEPIELPPKLVAALTLVFHELATNAAKHGALQLPSGEVSVAWRSEGNMLAIEWAESGGPRVAPPQRSGFGTGLFRRALEPFHGRIETQFEPSGLRCRIRIEVADRAGAPKQSAPASVPAMSS
jgi:two-component sensor histidine kinase